MGMLTALSLASAGYTITLRGKHGDRFDILRRHGIHFNLATDEDEILGTRPGRFGPALANYPYVFEVTGDESGWNAATRLISPGGSLFAISSFHDGVPRPLSLVIDKNVRVMGLRQGRLEPVLQILAAGLFDPTEVVSRVYPLDQGKEAYARVRERRERLVLLRMAELDQ
jgi:threonine dehydrogenase-like Zn-dependent dehydrogenase